MSTDDRPARTRTNGVGIAAAVMAMVLSLPKVLHGVLTGRMSEALPPLVLFGAMSLLLAHLVHRRRGSKVARTVSWTRLTTQAALMVGFFIALHVGLVAFAVAEAFGHHSYGWLLLIPFALWGLRVQVIGLGKVLRAAPDEMMARTGPQPPRKPKTAD